MRTCELIEKAVSAVPITRKWVITKKRNKGVHTKYNVTKMAHRVVAKGRTQDNIILRSYKA